MSLACKKMSEMAHIHSLAPGLCNRAAMLYESIADYWEAERWYRTSLSQQPSQIQPWFGLASTLLSQRADDEALEAAVCGLNNQPGHPWGLKLQQRALTNLQAIETLKDLNKKQWLPSGMPSEFGHSESRVDTSFQGHWDEPALSLQQRITIKAHLSASTPLVWCIGSGSHKVLSWLRDQHLLSSSSRVQIFGDPDADIAAQTSLLDGFDLDRSKPMYWVKHVGCSPDIVIVCQPRSDVLPVMLSELLRSPSTIVVADHSVGIELPGNRLISSLGSMNIFAPPQGLSE
jgi:hypothetical protein